MENIRPGEFIKAATVNELIAVANQVITAPGTFTDSSGTHTRRLPVAAGGGSPQVYEATANESEGSITIKKINQNGDLVGDDITVYVLAP